MGRGRVRVGLLMMMVIGISATLGLGWIVIACVGDEPAPNNTNTTTTSDAGSGGDASDGGAASIDAPDDSTTSIDGGPCNLEKDFENPVQVPGVNTTFDEGTVRLLDDELTIYFASSRETGTATRHLYEAKRASKSDPFETPTPLVNVNSGTVASDQTPALSADGGVLYFTSARTGESNLFRATRMPDNHFTVATALSDLNTPASETHPFLSYDGKELYFVSDRTPAFGRSFWRSVIDPVDGGFAPPTHVSDLSSTAGDGILFISRDGKDAYIGSFRSDPTNLGGADIFVAHRAGSSGPFGTITSIPNLNTFEDDAPGWLSPDGCRLYFESRRGASRDDNIYVASRPLK